MSLDWAQQEQTRQYNRRRKKYPSYAVGDVVLLSSEGINWPAFLEFHSELFGTF